jgi:hypothetical protein
MESARTYGKELTERPRATAQEALQPQRYSAQAASDAQVAHITGVAQRNGTIASAVTGAVCSAAVLAANALSPRFRNALGVSGKVALVVTPTAGAFWVKSFLTVGDAQRDPEEFMAARRPSGHAAPASANGQQQLSAAQQLANTVYTHPFKTILSIASPLYAYIFYKESTNPQTKMMPLSQRIIHTRVYGQMVAVLSTVAVMGFTETMRSSGGIYRIEAGRLIRGEPNALRRYHSDRMLSPVEREARRMEAEAEARRAEEGSTQGGRDGLDLLVPLLYAPCEPRPHAALPS